jgi:hypothetical protein
MIFDVLQPSHALAAEGCQLNKEWHIKSDIFIRTMGWKRKEKQTWQILHKYGNPGAHMGSLHLKGQI